MRQHLGEYDERGEPLGLVGDERLDEFVRPRRRLPTTLLTIVVMAVFAGGLWFLYQQGGRHTAGTGPGDAVPLIRADDKPTKIRPDQPGGMAVPDQNASIYNEKPGTPPVEKLLPPPEQPMPRPAAPKERAATAGPIAFPPPTAEAPQPAPAATPAPQQQAAATPVPKAAAKPEVKATPVAAPVRSVPAGPVRLQLGALRSPDAAKEEWARLKREHADLLGRLTAVAVRADLGDKGVWYRVQTQEFADAAAADRLCADLKKQKVGCSLAH
jgi:SPOR domain